MHPGKLHFRYTSKGRCEARNGPFHAIVENNGGTYRNPFSATLKKGEITVASTQLPGLTLSQTWLRDQIRLAIENATTFELADWSAEHDLDGRFKRRAAAHAKRHGLKILEVTQSETVLEKRHTIVRTYHCLRTVSEARPQRDATEQQRERA